MPDKTLLALNSGSSSLKFGVFLASDGEGRDDVRAEFLGEVESTGAPSQFEDAVDDVARKLRDLPLPPLAGIGHRVVHGGPELREHQLITPVVMKQLEAATHFAPLHIPVALKLIHAAQRRFPGVPEFACFDTAFHKTLPEAAARLPLPEKYWDAGVRRYGFHGLSCESILHTLGKDVPARMIVAHLGSGASITAIADGHSVDTTMGLTPTGGIIMGTRAGDIDPGVLLHILRHGVVNGGGNGGGSGSVRELENLLDKQSGLLGISGLSNDMRKLHEAAANNPQASLAIEMFSRSAKKAIAGFMAVLEGLDLLVFTGGIGEHDVIVREKICAGLAQFGIALDASANRANLPLISSTDSRAQLRVIPAEEEAQIARHTYRLLQDSI